MIYFVFMCVSCCLLLLHKEVTFFTDNHTYKVDFSVFIVIILFTVLTGARASSVGTDTINYVYSAKSVLHNYSSVASIFRNYYIEPGYGVLEYLCMKYTGDFHFLFCVEGLILLIGVFSFIGNFKDKVSVSLAFLVFFSFFYNTSLNISRQYIPVGIGLFATKYLLSNKRFKYLFCCFIAMLFHSSGLILFFSYFIWLFLNSSRIELSNRKKTFYLFVCMVLACLLIRPITNTLASFGVIPVKYVNFLHVSESASSAWFTVAANMPLVILLYLLRNSLFSFDERNRLAVTLYLLGFLVSLINSFFGNVGRLAVFWTSWQIILYPECCEILVLQQKNNFGKIITRSLFVIWFVLYWFYCVIYRGFGDTIPYISDIVPWINW